MGEILMTRSRFWACVLALVALAIVLVGFAPQVKAAGTVVDVNFKQLYFNYTASPANYENIVGDGKLNGDQVLWKNLITVDGTTVDALVTTTLTNATIGRYGNGSTGIAGDFKVNILPTAVGGYATFAFGFYKAGTYPTPSNPSATPEVLELKNVQITGKDIDESQFNSFIGVRGYTTLGATTLTVIPSNVTTWPANIKFQGPVTVGIDAPEHQAVVSFAEVTGTAVSLGSNFSTIKTGFYAITWQFVSFGSGGTTSGGQPATVTYDPNGGTGTAPASVTGVFGEIKGTVATGDGLSWNSYTFAGWNTARDGTGSDYTPGADLTIPATDTTLYAKWNDVVYTITYNGNNNTGGTAPAAGSYTSGGSAYIIAGAGSLVRTGYTFAGWNTAADGSGTTYAPAAPYSANANLTLYALWTLDDTATLKVKVMSRGTEAMSVAPIAEIYDGVTVELWNGTTWGSPQVTSASGEVDFGTVTPNVTHQVRLTAPCGSTPPVEIKTDLAVTTGNFSLTRTLAATVPCAPEMSYDLPASPDSLSWTEPNDGGSRIRYYTYWYNTAAQIASSTPWRIFARFWPADLRVVSLAAGQYGDATVARCPAQVTDPSPYPYNTTPPQCYRGLGAPVGHFYWQVSARNAVNVVANGGAGWGPWSNQLETNRP